MPTHWGRKETVVWPPHSPVHTYGAIFVSLLLTGLFAYLRFDVGSTPLQRFYTPIYLRSAIASGLGDTRKDKYRMLFIGGPHQAARISFEDDVVEGITPQNNDKAIPLTVSPRASQGGYKALYRGQETSYIDHPLHNFLKQNVYGGNGLMSIYEQPLLFGLVALLLQLPFSIARDIKRRKEMKYGRLLKGPVMLTPTEFGKQIGGDGIGFRTTESPNLMRIPARYEAQHIELMGDTGAGKTTLIMQVLRQIEERGQGGFQEATP